VTTDRTDDFRDLGVARTTAAEFARKAKFEQSVFAQRRVVVGDEAVVGIVARSPGREFLAELRGQFSPGFFDSWIHFHECTHYYAPNL